MSTDQEWVEAGEEPSLDAEDVFTPRQPPSRAMFTKRNEADLFGNPGLQDRTRDALRERGGQLIMFGDAGVGKSTLLKYAAEDEGMKMVSIKARSKSFDELIAWVLGGVALLLVAELVALAVLRDGAAPSGSFPHLTLIWLAIFWGLTQVTLFPLLARAPRKDYLVLLGALIVMCAGLFCVWVLDWGLVKSWAAVGLVLWAFIVVWALFELLWRQRRGSGERDEKS